MRPELRKRLACAGLGTKHMTKQCAGISQCKGQHLGRTYFLLSYCSKKWPNPRGVEGLREIARGSGSEKMRLLELEDGMCEELRQRLTGGLYEETEQTGVVEDGVES